jgi:Recombinase
VASRRQRRKTEKDRRHAPKPVTPLVATDGRVGGVERLVYSREQAADALGISLATLDRWVIPMLATVKTEWGARLIPAAEFDRYLAERTEQPRARHRRPTRAGRKSTLAAAVVSRILHESARGVSLAEIARQLNRDGVPTPQGGRQWWSSTVRAVLVRTSSTTASGAPSAEMRQAR